MWCCLELQSTGGPRGALRRCGGAEGKLQKVPVADSKKAEFEAAIKDATVLLDQYAPLDPAKRQSAKAAGNVSVSTPDAKGRAHLTVKDHLKPGDQVVVEVDAAKTLDLTAQKLKVDVQNSGYKKQSP